jgi:integrase
VCSSDLRNIHISATLKAWLDTVPQADREGKIVPPEWQRKAQRVRKESGIDGSEFQDAPRHTFGSFTVVIEGIDYVRSCMGHSHTAVFETHYLNALTIPQAKKYLEILPPKSSAKRKSRTA